ncbi:MAG: formate/nitrite transporter family protein [Peptoniphilaceae bacterium]|nr:formate/nitrite transporter family protein [Peptoniphilaceae bacterium]MDY6085174.1 formate/nitrite transporter family protein [Peptoniphilaceae bacterium]
MNKPIKTLLLSIAAGFMIGVGGTVFLAQKNAVVGAVAFTVGLFTIVEFGLLLFTGKACYLLQNPKDVNRALPLIWVGNLIGAFLMAQALRLTRLWPTLHERAAEIVMTKAGDALLSLFVLGALCNLLIYIAVEGYNHSRYETGRYLALFFGVVCFILAGFEHSVADMYYISVADAWSADMLVRLLVITLGNVVGGAMLPTLRQAAEKAGE